MFLYYPYLEDSKHWGNFLFINHGRGMPGFIGSDLPESRSDPMLLTPVFFKRNPPLSKRIFLEREGAVRTRLIDWV